MRLYIGLKLYECIDCGQVFFRSDYLNIYRRIYTGEKFYKCFQCLYVVCRRDMIIRYMRIYIKKINKCKFLFVLESDSDVRKSSLLSIDILDFYDLGIRLFSQSSIESVDFDGGLLIAVQIKYFVLQEGGRISERMDKVGFDVEVFKLGGRYLGSRREYVFEF